MKTKPFPEWFWFLKFPDSLTQGPRDQQRPCKTNDILFLTTLLTQYPDSHYFLQLANREIIPEPIEAHHSDYNNPVKARISRGTILIWIRNEFYSFRKNLLSGNLSDFMIEINTKKTMDSIPLKSEYIGHLGTTLKWPFKKDADILFNQFHELTWKKASEQRALKSKELYCPLDGPVTPILVNIETPEWTWESLCGRSWQLRLCPDCLGQFQRLLIEMN